MAPRTIDPDSPQVAAGQTRIDRFGGRITVGPPLSGGRWAVTYPVAGFGVDTLGADTIRQLYPIVTDAGPGGRRPA